MRQIYCFDIETIPQRRFLGAYEPDEYWLKEKWKLGQAKGQELRLIESLMNRPADEEAADYPCKETGQLPATHPATCHIVSVSTAVARTSNDPEIHEESWPVTKPLAEMSEDDILANERETVRLAWEQLAWALDRHLVLVSFNGKAFDLPTLRWRAAILGVTVPRVKWYELIYPFRHVEHIDLRLLLSDGDKRARGTLKTWCDAFGVESMEAGREIFGWVEKNSWDEISKYGAVEMRSLVNLFRAVEGAI